MYILTDDSLNETYRPADKYELEDKLNEIFDRDENAYTDENGTGHTIGEVIDDLMRKLGHEYVGEEEACLNITIRGCKDLQDVTGQESGVVVHDGTAIVCNWSHGEGVPTLFVGIAPLNYGSIDSAEHEGVEDTAQWLADHDVDSPAYDANDDWTDLTTPGLAADIWKVSANGVEVTVIAPKDWC